MSAITNEFREAALRNGFVVKSKRVTPTHTSLLNAAAVELALLGFQVDPTALAGIDVKDLEKTLAAGRKVIGADRNMKAIYPGFPKQVQEMDTAVLIMEQLLHYWTGGAFLPNYADVQREGLPLEDMARAERKLTVVQASVAAADVIKTLLANAVAMSDADRALLSGSVAVLAPTPAAAAALAENVTNGENFQAFVYACVALEKNTRNELLLAFLPKARTLDQVLRAVLATAAFSVDGADVKFERAVKNLSDSDARTVKMKTLSKPVRRLVVERVAALSLNYNADALVSRQSLWRRVMRSVHPFDLSLSESAQRAMDIVHSNVDYRTFNSLVEQAMGERDVVTAVELLRDNQPGNLLRRLVALLRLCDNAREAQMLANAVTLCGSRSTLTTLISSYNGVINANDTNVKLTKVAGRANTMREVELKPVNEKFVNIVAEALKLAMVAVLATKDAPKGAVKVSSDLGVPLVRRDAATTDRVLDRGERLAVAGAGDVLRIFSHWNNNQADSGYMDIGAVVMDKDFKVLSTCTWNSWNSSRNWATYSGDKHVYPGDNAAEYVDVDLAKLKKALPKAAWIGMTIQSWSGWPIENVDIIAGAMLRSNADKGNTFDARSVATAFSPTTVSTHSLPYVVDLSSNELVWLDTSNGSTDRGNSASSDDSLGVLVYNEMLRPRLTMGELATLWAQAHNAETVNEAIDKKLVLGLLN